MMTVLFFIAAIAILLLWATAISALMGAIRKQKATDERYSPWDIFSYILDVVLLLFFLYHQVIFMGLAIALPQEGWELLLGNIISTAGGFLVPVSVWTVARSIALRKEGMSRESCLMQLSCLPLYLIFLACTYVILS